MSDKNLLEKIILEKVQKSSEFLKPQWRQYLEFNYTPPYPKHREREIQDIALKLIDNVKYRSTRNILIHGPPGSGKTMSFKIAHDIAFSILKNLGEKDFQIIYVKSGKPIQTAVEICMKSGVEVPRTGFSVEDYLKTIEKASKNQYLHICLDEFDNLLINKTHFEKFLYFFTRTENVSATFITNRLNLAKEIKDIRILSTFNILNSVQFRPYDKDQVRDILQERIKMAFVDGSITEEAVDLLSKKIADDGGDIRKGLSILQICGEKALREGVYPITKELMSEYIREYEINADSKRLEALPLSDKIILAAIYKCIVVDLSDAVRTDNLFAEQDYYRKVLGLEGISYDSFTTYLGRLVAYGVISMKKQGLGRGRGTMSYVHLRYSQGVIRKLLENDESLRKIFEIIYSEIQRRRSKL